MPAVYAVRRLESVLNSGDYGSSTVLCALFTAARNGEHLANLDLLSFLFFSAWTPDQPSKLQADRLSGSLHLGLWRDLNLRFGESIV